MSRLSLPRLLLAGIAVLLLVLLLLWLLPDRSGQRRHQWAAPARGRRSGHRQRQPVVVHTRAPRSPRPPAAGRSGSE